jgi:hypothetical protein
MRRQLDRRLHEQALTMDRLRVALDRQLQRIIEIQADLDVLPHVRKSQRLRALLTH